MYLIDLHTNENTQKKICLKTKKNCVKQPAHPHIQTTIYLMNKKITTKKIRKFNYCKKDNTQREKKTVTNAKKNRKNLTKAKNATRYL